MSNENDKEIYFRVMKEIKGKTEKLMRQERDFGVASLTSNIDNQFTISNYSNFEEN